MSVFSLFSKGPASGFPDTLSARAKAPRDTASSIHRGVGCTHAPRPGSTARSSGVSRPSCSTTRSNSPRGTRRRHATHVRTGSILPASYTRGFAAHPIVLYDRPAILRSRRESQDLIHPKARSCDHVRCAHSEQDDESSIIHDATRWRRRGSHENAMRFLSSDPRRLNDCDSDIQRRRSGGSAERRRSTFRFNHS